MEQPLDGTSINVAERRAGQRAARRRVQPHFDRRGRPEKVPLQRGAPPPDSHLQVAPTDIEERGFYFGRCRLVALQPVIGILERHAGRGDHRSRLDVQPHRVSIQHQRYGDEEELAPTDLARRAVQHRRKHATKEPAPRGTGTNYGVRGPGWSRWIGQSRTGVRAVTHIWFHKSVVRRGSRARSGRHIMWGVPDRLRDRFC